MLSSRGSLTIDAVLHECVGRTATSHTSKVIPLAEAQNVWATIGTFIHHQMLLGHAITIPKFCSFWCRQKHVATQGNVRFYVRELCFGFTQSFATTYNLDPIAVPMEDLKLKYIKLPIDIISEDSRVPADIVTTIIREVSLFIGEGTFSGRSFMINVPHVVDVQLKKERAFISPSNELVTALFNIDSRKWPLDVRETAAAQVFRPRPTSAAGLSSAARSASSSRPGTARSHSSRPSTAATAAPLNNRPLFVTALPINKTFNEIENLPVREIRHKPCLPGAKGRAAVSAAGKAGGGVSHVDPMATLLSPSQIQAAAAIQYEPDEVLEEESVYDVLSPSRRDAARVNAEVHRRRHPIKNEWQRNDKYGDDDEVHYYDEDYHQGNNDDEDEANHQRWDAPPPPLLPHTTPRLAADSSRGTLNSNTRIGPMGFGGAGFGNPLVDRTSSANNENNNAYYTNAARSNVNVNAVGLKPSSSTVSTATPVGVPSCCKRIKAIFPWETALPEDGEQKENNTNAIMYQFGKRRFGGADAPAEPTADATTARPSAVATTPLFGRKRYTHTAEGTSVKGLLYDNMLQ